MPQKRFRQKKMKHVKAIIMNIQVGILLLYFIPLVWCNLELAAVSNSLFSRHMYVAVSDTPGNLVFSPLSAQMALGLLRLGAAGSTESQISQALHLDHVYRNQSNEAFLELAGRILEEDEQNGTTIRLANRLFVSPSANLVPEFQQDAEHYFESPAVHVNFTDNIATADHISKWVENITEHKIKQLITAESVDKNTQLVLVNALYFRSDWKYGFDPIRTKNRTFIVSDTESVKIPFMEQVNSFFIKNIPDLNASFIILPYQGDTLSMVILLPNKVTGLPDLERAMLKRNLQDVLNVTSGVEADELEDTIQIYVPRFTMEVALDLQEPLEKMGMKNMFSNNADFSGLVADKPIKVSKAVQKTFIEVTEKGTEAAAGTGIGLVTFSLLTSYEVNRPFLFYIVAQPIAGQTVVLFSGRFTSP